jgi:hypothetical protein
MFLLPVGKAEDFSGMGEERKCKSKNIMLEHNYARMPETWPTTAETPPIALLSASRKDYRETFPQQSLPASFILKLHQVPK